jgi:hypothetical protein
VYRLGPEPIRGREADFLKLEVDLERVSGMPEPVLEFSWESDAHTPCPALTVTASKSVLLVPMGCAPGWLLSDRLSQVNIRLANTESCSRFRLREIQLLHLEQDRPGRDR